MKFVYIRFTRVVCDKAKIVQAKGGGGGKTLE